MAEAASLQPEEVQEILSSDGPFSSAEEKSVCRNLVEELLSAEEQEVLAQTSYVYSYACAAASLDTDQKNRSECTTIPLKFIPSSSSEDEVRVRVAAREARRHLVANQGNAKKTLTALRDVCQFRKVRSFDLV
jgi:alpha-mannosidase